MKKKAYILASLFLILATLACRLPFRSSVSIDEETTVNGTIPDGEESTKEPAVETEADAVETEEVNTDGSASTGTAVYTDRGVEITLPSSYRVGDVEKDLAILVEGLSAMSEDSEDAADLQALYEKNKEDIMLWGYDTNSPTSHQTSVLVVKNEEFAGMSLGLISVVANALLGDELDSMSKESMTLGSRDVVRFETTSENAGVQTAQAIYIFNDSGKLWLIGFFTDLEQFEERLATFDTAVESFTVINVE
jgi:hypothetical protein